MCSIFGAISWGMDKEYALIRKFSRDFQETWTRSAGRGRTSWGMEAIQNDITKRWTSINHSGEVPIQVPTWPTKWIGNRRGEPTTEWVREKTSEDVQPFTSPGGNWTFTHNGTIANDKEIIRDEGAEWHETDWPPTQIDSYAIGVLLDLYGFEETLKRLQGSFAIIASYNRMEARYQAAHEQRLWVATNYKPMFYRYGPMARYVLIASQRDYLNYAYDRATEPGVHEIEPYTWGRITDTGYTACGTLYPKPQRVRSTLVVCSGGLDSGVVANHVVKRGDDVTLLHFDYLCKAGDQERDAIAKLASELCARSIVLSTNFFHDHATSRLTDDAQEVTKRSGGMAGAEFGYEWVPARNTVMLAMALAYAEANGYDTIALGNNLEESGGGYPDNEQEFINRFQALAPYALKPYHQVTFEQPLGTLMKSEIVKMGAQEDMPFELTWSCYEGGTVHCGSCGPCFMRQTAFKMAQVPDPTEYATNEE